MDLRERNLRSMEERVSKIGIPKARAGNAIPIKAEVFIEHKILEEAIVKLAASQESLADCIKHQTSVLERLIHSQEEIKHSINDINRK